MHINVEKLSFGYKSKSTILKNIDFRFDDISSLGIVGVSGSGKSTLLRLLSGHLSTSAGHIRIDGLSPLQHIKQLQTSFMFQNTSLLPNLTVYDNILLALKLQRKIDLSFAEVMMNKVGLSGFRDYFPHQISGGMQARVALARTFVTHPKYIFLDESFSALDMKWKIQLYSDFENLRRDFNASFIFVTHNIDEALLLSNHILVLGSCGEIISSQIIDQPLPRIYNSGQMRGLDREYEEIFKAIML